MNDDGTKDCLGCKQSFPATTEFFYKNNTNRRCGWLGVSLVALCKPCWKKKNQTNRAAARLRKAGRPMPSRCEGCGAGISQPKTGTTGGTRYGDAVWDHNHDSGEFRGWLCGQCNRALGFAGDNPKILDALAAYLRSRGFGQKRPFIR